MAVNEEEQEQKQSCSSLPLYRCSHIQVWFGFNNFLISLSSSNKLHQPATHMYVIRLVMETMECVCI